ncbi:TetR/AcrR family transcriptional regulator C-terminal domain-containing protein [Nocardioides jejuensis]|uniref:TetR/AcrR family transcriptional regulator n=1 Tax=Nocardioides jejuensis TaxID=2502782 RepID=A0A4R1CGT6_9ACTN|nr:TetR/AcrR family transcriptional regulator C-terminal domain-containing protein [Nocardioides jejuensis]TCJ30583.1 TetR/AcrR family transcriptional regulator [Nocardioides jejuensis]
MSEVPPRRAGRPSKAVLDRGRIGSAALELVDETGDFTLPALARRLGVQAASLYHHVEGRAGVIELLREQVAATMDLRPLDYPVWDQALLGFFRSYRDVFAAHPRVVPLLTTATVRSAKVIEAYDRMAARLAEAGIPPARAMRILTALDNFVIGSALDLAAPDVMWEVPSGVEAPALSAALAAQPAGRNRADDAFEEGLTRLLASLATEFGVTR